MMKFVINGGLRASIPEDSIVGGSILYFAILKYVVDVVVALHQSAIFSIYLFVLTELEVCTCVLYRLAV